MPGGMCPLNDSSKRIIDKTTDSSLAGQRSTFPNLEVKNDSESIFRQLYATPEMRPLGRHSLNLEPQVADVIIADGEVPCWLTFGRRQVPVTLNGKGHEALPSWPPTVHWSLYDVKFPTSTTREVKRFTRDAVSC